MPLWKEAFLLKENEMESHDKYTWMSVNENQRKTQ